MENKSNNLVLAGTPKHLELTKPLKKSKKAYLLLNISGSCNYNCKKCCNLVPNKRVLLSLNTINSLIAEAKNKLGTRTVVFIGEGETTLAPNFKEIISKVHSEGMHSIIFTNGYFIDRKMAKFLAENNTSIVFSVDSLEKEKYENLTGTNNTFEKVMQNIKYCREIFDEKSEIIQDKRKVQLAINMLLMKDNKAAANKLIKFCKKDVLPVFNYPLMTGNALENNILFSGTNTKTKNLFSPTNLLPNENKCGYFFHGITIGLDGSILACPYSLEQTGKTINISEIGLEKAATIHDKMIQKFREMDNSSYCVMRSHKYKEFIKNFSKE